METYADVHIWQRFEFTIATTLTAGWKVVVFISIVIIVVANVIKLWVVVSGEVGRTLVVFLTVVLIGISRRGDCERGRKRTLRCLWTMSFMSAEQYW